jgi:DNA-binding MarR family transcriptional regulator
MPRRSTERDLGLEFWLAYGVYRQALVHGLNDAGFTDLREVDATLLRYLHHSGGATVNELARVLQVTKQAASQHTASLVKRGYVTREPSPDDKRERVVRLTDRGHAARAAAITFADQIEQELIDTVGTNAVRGLRRVLEGFLTPRLGTAPEAIRIGATMKSTPE